MRGTFQIVPNKESCVVSRGGSAERKVPGSSYQNTACTATSGLAVSAMPPHPGLILAELGKDAPFPQRVLNCGAIFGYSRASGDQDDSQAQELHIVILFVVSIRHCP